MQSGSAHSHTKAARSSGSRSMPERPRSSSALSSRQRASFLAIRSARAVSVIGPSRLEPGQLDFFPPLRPALAFCDFDPPPLLLLDPLLLLELLLPPPLFLPPFDDAFDVLEILAARSLLMPFLRRPSYCLSFLTLEPWSLAMVNTSFCRNIYLGRSGAKRALFDERRVPQQAQAEDDDLAEQALRHTGRRSDQPPVLDRHGLGLGVLLDALGAVAASHARGLHPAHRGIDRSPGGDVALVDVHGARVQPGCQLPPALGVARPDAEVQPVVAVV